MGFRHFYRHSYGFMIDSADVLLKVSGSLEVQDACRQFDGLVHRFYGSTALDNGAAFRGNSGIGKSDFREPEISHRFFLPGGQKTRGR